jgi:hypothetical protein
MTKLIKFSVIFVILITAIAEAGPTGYTVTILHSPDFNNTDAIAVSGSQQVGVAEDYSKNDHAMLWSGSAAGYVDLTPTGYTNSDAVAVSGGQQIGTAQNIASGKMHALLWNSSADNYVDLNPTGFTHSFGYDIDGGRQVGYGGGTPTDHRSHAIVWSGTAESYHDLHPSTGFDYSYARGISGNLIVGDGTGTATGDQDHALLWTWDGTSSSFKDIHPADFINSEAKDVDGSQIVGYGRVDDGFHALLWTWDGTDASVVDLHDDDYAFTRAFDIANGMQVGYGIIIIDYDTWEYEEHALLWSGTAESCISLNSYLPIGYTSAWANGIDSAGNIVGGAYDASGNYHALMWTPIPAPGAILLGAFGIGCVARLRRSKKI